MKKISIIEMNKELNGKKAVYVSDHTLKHFCGFRFWAEVAPDLIVEENGRRPFVIININNDTAAVIGCNWVKYKDSYICGDSDFWFKNFYNKKHSARNTLEKIVDYMKNIKR